MDTKDNNAHWKRGDPIGYIRREIPDFDLPTYDGQRYEALVPDTFDLQERAELGINVLTRATDPDADHEIYFAVQFHHNPPVMSHDYADQCQVKFMEALPLLRIITGSDLNMEVDRKWMEVAMRGTGPDGIVYTPLKGRPWALIGGAGYNVTDVDEQFIQPFFPGRLLSAMMNYHRLDGGSLWQREAERVVDGLVSLAVDRATYAYFAPSCHRAVKGSTNEFGKRYPLIGAHVAFVALGLVHAYRVVGYEPARNLAGKLIRYLLDQLRYFGEDGSFTPGNIPPREQWAHFHMHTYSLLAMLEYARVTGDADLTELVRRGYEYAKAHGETLVGYFPENLGSWELEHSELCEVADMIAISLKLTEYGVGDYLDDVDRWARNMFAEEQLTPAKGDWLKRHAAGLPVSPIDPMYQTSDRVVERNVGGFAGWPTPNEWGSSMMQCCTGNGTRAIYYLWENAVSHDSGRLRVNLLLNRASRWADVDSHIPYVGQVDVKVKEPVNLSIRTPEWVQPSQVHVAVNSIDRRIDWDGRYALAGETKPGDVATMTFPIGERTDTVWIEKQRYTLVRKGNEVVAIDPPGMNCPLYLREHFRDNTTRWRKTERVVPERELYV